MGQNLNDERLDISRNEERKRRRVLKNEAYGDCVEIEQGNKYSTRKTSGYNMWMEQRATYNVDHYIV